MTLGPPYRTVANARRPQSPHLHVCNRSRIWDSPRWDAEEPRDLRNHDSWISGTWRKFLGAGQALRFVTSSSPHSHYRFHFESREFTVTKIIDPLSICRKIPNFHPISYVCINTSLNAFTLLNILDPKAWWLQHWNDTLPVVLFPDGNIFNRFNYFKIWCFLTQVSSPPNCFPFVNVVMGRGVCCHEPQQTACVPFRLQVWMPFRPVWVSWGTTMSPRIRFIASPGGIFNPICTNYFNFCRYFFWIQLPNSLMVPKVGYHSGLSDNPADICPSWLYFLVRPLFPFPPSNFETLQPKSIQNGP